jgi:hypothetical protein
MAQTTTKRIIADQVLQRLAGGFPDVQEAVQKEDIFKAIEQKINSMFKIQHFNQTLASGETTIPENLALATYDDVTVTSFNGKSKATLPIIPISLPRNMGIFLVYDADFPDNPFIPLLRGQSALLKSDTLLNDLMGQIGYEPKNTEIVFTKDITQFGIDEVTMELVVFDITQYNETDLLPVPSDYAEQIVNELVNQFSNVVPETGIVNNYSPLQNKPQGK